MAARFISGTVARVVTVTAALAFLPLAGPASGATRPAGPESSAIVTSMAPSVVASADHLTSASVESFVRAGYADFLGRSPSTGDLMYWGPRIQAGTMGRWVLTQELARSPEWLTAVISGFYRDTLGRGPDPVGLAFWIQAARSGTPIADIAAQFYASDEYFRTVGHSDVQTWVRALYRALLLREGEAGGVTFWTRLVGSGTPRWQAAATFYQSTETVQVRIQALYHTLLGRGADQSGLSSWPAVVRAQGDLALASSIAESPEYFARASSRFPGNGSRAPWVEVVGTGTPASCTTTALAAAVRDGGVVEFSCGSAPTTIVLTQTLETCNTTTCQHQWQGGTPVDALVIDGGGLVTLSGGGARGIFYANTCEQDFGWLSSRCDLQTQPRIVFRNLTFADGNAQGPPPGLDDVGGGGAIAMRGGTLVVEDVTFRNNRTVAAHSDWGGGAVRVFGVSTATFTRCTFTSNRGANGGALSSLHTPMLVTDSVFTGNAATGSGASSGQGGNGGAIYFDGTGQDVRVVGTSITGNAAPEGGPGIFYVSNDRSGALTIERSTITGNTGERFWTSPYHDLYYLGRSGLPIVSASTID